MFRKLFLGHSILRTLLSYCRRYPLSMFPSFSVNALAALTVDIAPLVLGTGSSGAGGAVLDDDVDFAALKARIDELYKPGYDISATWGDDNFGMILDMDGLREHVRQRVLAGPPASFVAPADKDRVFDFSEWSTCIRGHSNHIVGKLPPYCLGSVPLLVLLATLCRRARSANLRRVSSPVYTLLIPR